MTRVLVVHHTPSPSLHELLGAVVEGAGTEEIEAEVEIVRRPALTAGAADALACDGIVLGTPANIGTMSGALKHFFDQIYYPCLESTVARPYGLYVHGNNDTTGAIRAVEMVTTGLQWRLTQAPVSVVGEPTQTDLDACWELGAAVAAGLS